jgi:hypothetical protein
MVPFFIVGFHMPLLDGSSDDIIRENYKELKSTGKYSEAQCWAIAMKKGGKSKAAERAVDGVTAKPKANKMRIK